MYLSIYFYYSLNKHLWSSPQVAGAASDSGNQVGMGQIILALVDLTFQQRT